MSAYISVKNPGSPIITTSFQRLSFPLVVVAKNFPNPPNHIIGSSIPFREEGDYKVSLKLNLSLSNIERFHIAAYDQYMNIMETSEITYLQPISTPDDLLKTFTVAKSFFHLFKVTDSVQFFISIPDINPGAGITIETPSNINIFKL